MIGGMVSFSRGLNLLLPFLLTSCSLSLGSRFDRAAQRAPASALAAVELVGGELTRGQVDVAEADVPAEVLRIESTIQPGGERTVLARAFGPTGDGFRFVRRYPRDAACPERSVLLAADGTVLERSHALPVNEAPAAVLERSASVAAGQVTRIHVVQGQPGEEWYRIHLAAADGTRHLLECETDGTVRLLVRLLAGEIAVPR